MRLLVIVTPPPNICPRRSCASSGRWSAISQWTSFAAHTSKLQQNSPTLGTRMSQISSHYWQSFRPERVANQPVGSWKTHSAARHNLMQLCQMEMRQASCWLLSQCGALCSWLEDKAGRPLVISAVSSRDFNHRLKNRFDGIKTFVCLLSKFLKRQSVSLIYLQSGYFFCQITGSPAAHPTTKISFKSGILVINL